MAKLESDDVKRAWREEFAVFREDTYPAIFEPQGVSFADAYMIWMLNRVAIALENVVDAFTEVDDEEALIEEGERWKHGKSDGTSDASS